MNPFALFITICLPPRQPGVHRIQGATRRVQLRAGVYNPVPHPSALPKSAEGNGPNAQKNPGHYEAENSKPAHVRCDKPGTLRGRK